MTSTSPAPPAPTVGVINLGGTPFVHECCNSSANTFVGLAAGNFTITGHDNTGYGFQALQSLTTGDFNTATGYLALQAVTAGLSNTATGFQALRSNTMGATTPPTATTPCLSNVTGSGNTATGSQALNHNTANENTADGANALNANTTGIGNTASGAAALISNTTGSGNTAVGDGALIQNTTSDQNTAVGVSALTFSTGFGNTALGGFAGAATNANKTGSQNTFIGWSSGPGVSTEIDNATAIGANAVVSESNALVLGASGVNVGIGTPTPSTTLEVNGVATFDMPVAFAAGQTFPGTVTAVTAGTDLAGGGAGGILTLGLDTTKVPQLATANTFAAGPDHHQRRSIGQRRRHRSARDYQRHQRRPQSRQYSLCARVLPQFHPEHLRGLQRRQFHCRRDELQRRDRRQHGGGFPVSESIVLGIRQHGGGLRGSAGTVLRTRQHGRGFFCPRI